MTTSTHPIFWLHHADQRLGLLPSLGGGVAAWQLNRNNDKLDLWRPWAGSTDRYTLASFPLVPWSNRISAGGFEFDGVFYPMAPNRDGEPYPIHGDGWLQRWTLNQPQENTVEMTLDSQAFDGNPYVYTALQRFELLKGGMDQTLKVTHTGIQPLPYGLGQHPFFPRSADTRLTTSVQGVWLSGHDSLPAKHTAELPDGWDPRGGMSVNGSLIDNAYTGWSGQARIDWPDRQLALTIQVPDILARGQTDGVCLLYRSPVISAFCFEPVTHPIDAFHIPGLPGLRLLRTGESLMLKVQWRFADTAPTASSILASAKTAD
ncbi:MAG: aldose 1-epimerase [Comamonadaceae bacterium]|nr:aldose 1-epimerase [Comamonadaceae bacterium]